MAVREGLLALLDEGSRYGYQLKTEFEGATGGIWPLNVGQVYTTLDRLERDGLVTMTELGGQKSYDITPAGREELGAWWQAVPVDDPPPRDELMLKVLMAIEHGPAHALAVLTRQRTALVALLQQRRREGRARTGDAPSGDPEVLASRLVADALVVRAEADLRWLDLCESRLTAAASSPPRFSLDRKEA
jgi:DNA-binding PadR family transcriptional regulator